MKRTRVWIGVALLFTVLSVFIAAWLGLTKSPGKPGPSDKITLGVVPAYFSLPILVAADQGYFIKNGLDVTVNFAGSGLVTLEMLVRGDVDFATASDSGFVVKSLEAGNENLRIIASLATNDLEELVARRDHGIQAITDLRGKRVGIPWNSAVHFSFYRFLILQGIPPEEVTLVDLSYPKCLEAILKGEIDATLLFDYLLYDAKQQLGVNAVSWQTRSTQPSYWLLIGKSESIQNQPAISQRLLTSLLEAQAFIRAHPIEAEAMLAHSAPRDPEFLRSARETSHFEISLEQGLIVAMEDEADWRIERGLAEKAAAPNYLHHIYMDALDAVKPEAITIFR
ncbi:MAG: ABC transporter substrate-binding protein [Chloroflexi bacterium]|nr:ABC transporter substrate-binding protein [Chloroflexota bacterium]